MACTHDITEREVAVTADGYCPLCQASEIKKLRKENERLRNALAPFSCLRQTELRPGDFNRARRALAGTR